VSKGGLGSWEDAARHPLRTLTLMFIVGAVATGLVSYYDGVRPRSPWLSCAIGIGCGVILVVIGRKRIAAEREGQSPEIAVRPVSLFSVVVALAGVVICVWGIAAANWGLAASGLPLAALGLSLIALRWWLRARARPSDSRG